MVVWYRYVYFGIGRLVDLAYLALNIADWIAEILGMGKVVAW